MVEVGFGGELRSWRRRAGVSQLELALRCGASQRHISFLESGRARPSREMVFAVSEALNVPLRYRNELLLAAGFAPVYRQRGLEVEELRPVKDAIDRILIGQEPYPAVVYDWLHHVYALNDAAQHLYCFLFDVEAPDQLPALATNVLRSLLHPEGYRRHIRNWTQVAGVMLRRLQAEIAAAGNPADAVALLDELASYSSTPAHWRKCHDLDWRHPMLTVDVDKDGRAFSLFSTVVTLGAPFDVTLQEIRIEIFFPADDNSADFFKTLQHSVARA